MESVCTCNICCEPFSEIDRIPKIMMCGHTICLICLRNLEIPKRCPTCREISSFPESCPTNFAILRVCETLSEKSVCDDSAVVLLALETIKRKLIKQRQTLLDMIDERNCLLSIIDDKIPRIQNILNRDVRNWNADEVEKFITEMGDDLKKIDSKIYYWKSNLKSNFSLDSFIGVSCFLYEIVNRLHNGEEMYAYKLVPNSGNKYGKLTLSAGRINVHSLDLYQVDENKSIISLQDLKKCIKSQNLGVFFKIESSMLNFAIVSRSFKSSRLIKLCTGEEGLTYKGERFVSHQSMFDQPYLKIDKVFKFHESELESLNDYYDASNYSSKEMLCAKEDVVVEMHTGGRFLIRRCYRDATIYNVVAKSLLPLDGNLSEVNPAVIDDCGIFLSFEP